MTLRVDGHQHFWTLERGDYGWLTPDLAPIYRDFSPADLAPLLAETGIDCTVVVQAAPTVDETRYLLELAEQNEFIAGVVGWIDMESGATAAAEIAELARYPKLVGLRPMIQDVEDPAWITRPELGAATQAMIDHDLCFDALVRSDHLPHLLVYLERHPALKAVIDHGAKPGIGAGEWQPWAGHIAAIAERTPACCKLSGLITEAGVPRAWNDLTPYLDHLLDAFGVERLLWGSDWPVVNLAGDYVGWHGAFTTWLSKLTAEERAGIAGGNALRIYGLAANQG